MISRARFRRADVKYGRMRGKRGWRGAGEEIGVGVVVGVLIVEFRARRFCCVMVWEVCLHVMSFGYFGI